ncbi:POU domain, class 5, transcription factor 1.1-like [Discoglossus pictus]
MTTFLGYPHDPPPVFHFTGITSDYGDFYAQAGEEKTAQVSTWNPMATYDQMGAQGSGQVTSPNTVNSVKYGHEGDQEEVTDTNYTPALSAMAGVCSTHLWNQNFWPEILPNNTPSYPLPSLRLPMIGAFQGGCIYPPAGNQSPETPREDGAVTMEGSHCTTNSPPNDPGNYNTTNGNLVDLSCDLEVDPLVEKEMGKFARELKYKRVQMGITQADVGFTLGTLCGKLLSQTTICRFESLQLSYKNMCRLKPILELWLAQAETTDDLQDLINREPAVTLPKTRKRKRRTNIDPADRMVLENHFIKCRNPGKKTMFKLATELNMDKDVVRVWFCNRRHRGKYQSNISLSDDDVFAALTLLQANGEAYDMSQMGPFQDYAAPPMGAFPDYPVDDHANEMYSETRPIGNHSISRDVKS